jgi:gliding-associated putative ABC transporter substrate-binding component GldG
MKEKKKIRRESTLFLVLLIGILIVVNLLSWRFSLRGDLTQNGIYSLSDVSISLVRNLDDQLVVKGYFTKNLPGRFATLERRVGDLLEEYKEQSRGKMQLEFIDPAGDPKEEEVAKSLGIQKMPNPDIEKDQATVKEGYRGISFSYGDGITEVIRAVDSPVGLEYKITSVLKKMLGKKAEIGFLVGHGEPSIEPETRPNQPIAGDGKSEGAFRTVRNNLDIYNYTKLDLKRGVSQVPEGIRGLVIAGPRETFEDKELYAIDQFLLRGGSVVFFVDGVNIQASRPQHPSMPIAYHTSLNEPNIRDFLKHHGIALGQSLVMDLQAANYPAKCPPFPIPLPRPYPAWPIITAFEENSPITFNLGSVTLPYATDVRVTKEAEEDENLEAYDLAFSSGNAWTAGAGSAEVDPCKIQAPEELQSGVPVAAAAKGTFTSYFKGKEIPQTGTAGEGASTSLKDQNGFVEKSLSPGRLVVVGSSGLPTDENIAYLARMDRRQAMGDFAFVQNILDWMTNEEGLIAVRMKTLNDPPIERASEAVKTAVKYGNIIGLPLALVLFGLLRWRIRRSKKSKLKG